MMGFSSARQLEPRLTTVQQDTEQIGCLAARELISLIERPKTTIIEQVIVPGKVAGRQVGSTDSDRQIIRHLYGSAATANHMKINATSTYNKHSTKNGRKQT